MFFQLSINPPLYHAYVRRLRKPKIDLSRSTIHVTYTTRIFLKVFCIRTNTVNVRGKQYNMNES